MSIIHTIPIKELCNLVSVPSIRDKAVLKHETFIIPNYQRGYRWEADIQVNALLNDLFDFMNNWTQHLEDKYCLQPIVVSASPTKAGAWEVIDGQQRLTTLYFLLKALGLPSFDIEFETRIQSSDFLHKLIHENKQNHTQPDFHFMSAAWEKINKWLEQKNNEDIGFKLNYSTILINNVNVIWNDIESQDRKTNINVFNRLNIGKIPLTDSELVKALLLSKIKGLYNGTELALRQSEINNEWHNIEIELQKPQKWDFLTANTSKTYESHIELIFDLLAQNKNQKNYTTYMWFERQINQAGKDGKTQALSAISLWKEIKRAYARINSWFCDATPDTVPTIYHYVGYLLASQQIRLDTLFEKSKDLSQKDFIADLRKEVCNSIEHVDLDAITYESNPTAVKRVLLLFNVLSCEKISEGIYNRFPFDRYNAVEKERRGNGGWSLEHIFAQNSQDPLKGTKAIYAWLQDSLDSLKNIDSITKPTEEGDEVISIDDLKEEIREMYKLPEKELDIDAFNDLRNRVNEMFGELPKHVLSNMALLSTADNSSLNNSIFPVKRDKIILLEKQGRFIPPCTRNVFLKFYSLSDSQPYYWGVKDQAAYLAEIKKVIGNFKDNL